MATRSRYLYLLRYVLLISDILLINLSFFIAFLLSYKNASLFGVPYLNYLLVWNLLWLVSAGMFGLYRSDVAQHLVDIYRASGKALIFHVAFFAFYHIFAANDQIQRSFLLIVYCLEAMFLLVSRFSGTLLEVILSKRFSMGRPVAVMGTGETGRRLAGFLEKSQNFQFGGFLIHEDSTYIDEEGSLRSSVSEQLAEAAARGIKDVYVTLKPDRMVEAVYLLEEAERQCVRLKFIPDLHASLAVPFKMTYMGEFPVISMREEPLDDIQNRFKKRVFDMVFSSLVLVFVMSWLVPVIGLIIKIQSPGPVFFRQQRSGRNNEPFWCYKFRSMRVNKDSDRRQASRDDDRITPIGRFLRKSSLDELPQFFNVFLGNMSVIGPRPHMLKHTEQYSAIINRYMVRQFLKPGISGWAQVNGFRGETEDPRLMESRVEHDIWYMENWSLMLDVKIIFMTVINMFKGEEMAF